MSIMAIVCFCVLAVSAKHHDLCIAGKEVVRAPDGCWIITGKWVRPVGAGKNGAVTRTKALLVGCNRLPKPLDIVSVDVENDGIVAGQPENRRLKEGAAWEYWGHFKSSVSSSFLDSPCDIWLESGQKSDRVRASYSGGSKNSLYFIKPDRFYIHFDEYMDNETGQVRKKRRVAFKYCGVDYDLSLTDIYMQERYFPAYPNVDFGRLKNGPSCVSGICVSLAPEFHGGFRYKLVASVVE